MAESQNNQATEPNEEAKKLWAEAIKYAKASLWEQVLKVLDKLQALNENNPKVYYNRAQILIRLGKYAEALPNARQTLALKPEDELAKKAIALIEKKLAETSSQSATEETCPDPPPTSTPPVESVAPPQEPELEPAQLEELPLEPEPESSLQSDDKMETKQLDQLLPIAEMRFKAGMAIWMVLTVLMIIVHDVRLAMGIGYTSLALAIAVGIYAGCVYAFISTSQKWITPETEDPKEKRIFQAVTVVAQQACLPRPHVAMDRHTEEINACTYGLGRKEARIVVNEALIDELQPTDDELASVIAHEISHIQHNDYIISTLLKFPVWLIQKIGIVVKMIRSFMGLFLKGFLESGAAFGLVGLIILGGILYLMLYLSILAFIITAAIFLCIFFLSAFEREREYLADLYAANMMKTPAPMQHILAKLERAHRQLLQKLKQQQLEKQEQQSDGQSIEEQDTDINPEAFVNESLEKCPSLASSLMDGELFDDHPMTQKRIYFLQNPTARKKLLSRFMARCFAIADKAMTNPQSPPSNLLRNVVILGIATGLVLVILPLFKYPALEYISLVSFLLGGIVLGICAKKQRWSGETFTRQAILASFISATTLLVTGPLLLSPLTFFFPAIFLIGLIGFGLVGFLISKITPAPGVASDTAPTATDGKQ